VSRISRLQRMALLRLRNKPNLDITLVNLIQNIKKTDMCDQNAQKTACSDKMAEKLC
jgi:hypothetical protein